MDIHIPDLAAPLRRGVVCVKLCKIGDRVSANSPLLKISLVIKQPDGMRVLLLTKQNRISYNAINHVINGATKMNTISANDLKTRGVSAIEQALADQQEASVTVRGKMKYVVMSRDHYAHLRECELEAALAESKADLDAGRFVKESVEQHIKRLAELAV